MKMTTKDKEFLERLKPLCEKGDVSVEMKEGVLRHLVLRKNYGSKVARAFGMSRQGVRWRFQRLFNHIYVEAYCTILFIETAFGTHLRQQAMAIARQRFELRQRVRQGGGRDASGFQYGKQQG